MSVNIEPLTHPKRFNPTLRKMEVAPKNSGINTFVKQSFIKRVIVKDSYRFKGLRKKLVQQLQAKGILDQDVLDAFEKVPRHFFLDTAFAEHAYEDKPFPIGEGQTISQPYTVAYQTDLLDVKPGNKVLEIGTGSGYQACILAELGAEVYTIERVKTLYETAKNILWELGYTNIYPYHGDGTLGLPEEAPFDRIIVTAGAPDIPQTYLEQMAIGGIMVIPVGGEAVQKMFKVVKTGKNHYEKETYSDFRFVSLRGKAGWE